MMGWAAESWAGAAAAAAGDSCSGPMASNRLAKLLQGRTNGRTDWMARRPNRRASRRLPLPEKLRYPPNSPLSVSQKPRACACALALRRAPLFRLAE